MVVSGSSTRVIRPCFQMAGFSTLPLPGSGQVVHILALQNEDRRLESSCCRATSPNGSRLMATTTFLNVMYFVVSMLNKINDESQNANRILFFARLRVSYPRPIRVVQNRNVSPRIKNLHNYPWMINFFSTFLNFLASILTSVWQLCVVYIVINLGSLV